MHLMANSQYMLWQTDIWILNVIMNFRITTKRCENINNMLSKDSHPKLYNYNIDIPSSKYISIVDYYRVTDISGKRSYENNNIRGVRLQSKTEATGRIQHSKSSGNLVDGYHYSKWRYYGLKCVFFLYPIQEMYSLSIINTQPIVVPHT